LIKSACNFLIVLAVLISLYLLLGWLILHNDYADTVRQTGLSVDNSESYTDKVAAVNSQLNMVESIQNSYYPLSLVLDELASAIPPGITVSSAKIDRANQAIELQGLAHTRDDLLALKTELDDSDMFDEINLPISNILQKDNITFAITAKLIINDRQ